MRAGGNRLAVLLLSLGLAGCATYGQQQEEAVRALEQGRYAEAEGHYQEGLPATGDLALLHHMEIGLMAHHQGDYERSNSHLEVADQLRDSLLASDYSQYFSDLLTSPALGVYRGASYEYAWVNYFKALNYLLLAQESGDSRWLDAARVEARRLNIILSEYAANAGDYTEAATDEEALTETLMAVLRQLAGNGIDPDELVYRDDAWGRFLVGVGYEAQGEWDNARISYQQAAEAYEAGYAEQYNLGPDAARLAWTQVVRMMRTGGGYGSEPGRLMEEHGLSPEETAPLGNDEALLFLVDHHGRTQDIGEMNLVLYKRPEIEALMLRPIIAAEPDQARAQQAWFTLHYADRGIGDLLLRYQTGGAWELFNDPLTSKQVPLGPLWDLAEDTGILAGIGPVGIRVAVPWYPPAGEPPEASRFQAEKKGSASFSARGELVQVADMEQAKRQERLRLAQSEMQAALMREILKNVTGRTAGAVVAEGDETLGLLVELIGRAAATSSARAETRHWSSLPGSVHAQVLRLPAGEHELSLQRQGRTVWKETVALPAGETRIRTTRTFGAEQ